MSSQKSKKSDQAFAIFKKHMHLRDSMKPRAFRTLVVEEMSKELGVTNKGTLGMYFAWSQQVVGGKPRTVYSRGDGARRAKGANDVQKQQDELNKLMMGVGAKKKAAKKQDDAEDAPFVPTGFGLGSFGARL
jgi:hypothetical protein